MRGLHYYNHVLSPGSLGVIDIGDIRGIGRAYAKKLRSHGVKTAYDFTDLSPALIKRKLTVVEARIHQELKGVPCLALETEKEDKVHYSFTVLKGGNAFEI